MVVHGDDAVFHLIGGLGGAHAHARRVGAVVAQQGIAGILHTGGQVFVQVVGEGVVELFEPHPLDVLMAFHGGHVVGLVAGFDDGSVFLGVLEGAGVDDHGPALGLQGLGVGFIGADARTGLGRAGHGGQAAAQGKDREARHLQKGSSAFVHYLFPLGRMWQVQQ